MLQLPLGQSVLQVAVGHDDLLLRTADAQLWHLSLAHASTAPPAVPADSATLLKSAASEQPVLRLLSGATRLGEAAKAGMVATV